MTTSSEARNQVAAAIRSLVHSVGRDHRRKAAHPRKQRSGRSGLVFLVAKAERVRDLWLHRTHRLGGEARVAFLLEAAITSEPFLPFLLRGCRKGFGETASPIVTAHGRPVGIRAITQRWGRKQPRCEAPVFIITQLLRADRRGRREQDPSIARGQPACPSRP